MRRVSEEYADTVLCSERGQGRSGRVKEKGGETERGPDQGTRAGWMGEAG